MEKRAYAIAAGLFTVLLAVAVFFTAQWLTGGTVAREPYDVVSGFPVTGLNPRAAVRFRGVEVGRVEAIRLNPKDQQEILVRIQVDDNVKLTKSTFGQLGFQGVTGIAHVQLEDDGSSQEVLKSSRGSPARIPMRPSFVQQLSESGQDLLASVNETAQRINTLLGPPNQEAVSRLLERLAAAAGRIETLAADLEPAARALPGVLSDTETVLKRADTLLGRMAGEGGAMDQVARSAGQIGATADRVGSSAERVGDTMAEDVAPQILRTTRDLSRSSRNMDRLVRSLEDDPRSVVFGRSPPAPGPGEPGFTVPAGAQK